MLIEKLYDSGIRGLALDLIFYLNHRKLIRQELPQGLIIGPLIFLLYVNSIALYLITISTSVYQFAADTSVVVAHGNIESIIRVCIEEISKMKKW